MALTTRPAIACDAPAMAELLNAVIVAGGTTAHQRTFDADRMLHHYVAAPKLICCTVAVLDGQIVGFQSLAWPNERMPAGWAYIATFAKIGMTGRGIGKALFAETLKAATTAHVTVIDATIRADNTGGLAYYGKMGFRDYDRLIAVPLRDGSCVDRIRKRYDIG